MTTENKATGPVPVPQQESDFYWEKLKAHELWLRKCNETGKAYFYPRDISPFTFSLSFFSIIFPRILLIKLLKIL